jgi:hypothetical protein
MGIRGSADMTYALIVYAHIVAAILLVGYGLFWVVMTTATRRQRIDAAEQSRLPDVTRRAAWPLGGGKLTLPRIGWLGLIAAAITGVLCLPDAFAVGQLFSGQEYGTLLLAKLVLVAVLIACFPRLGSGPTWVAWVSLASTVAIVALSVLVVR